MIVDEQTGFHEWSDNMVRQKWDQAITHRRRAEQRHPQEFVYPLNDPVPVKHVRESEALETPDNSASSTVGATGIAAPKGPAFHLFSDDI